MTTTSPHFQALIYSNPDHYPPIINGARVLAQRGYTLDILSRDYHGAIDTEWVAPYPTGVRIRRLPDRFSHSLLRYVWFIIRALLCADRSAALFIGHDMHGLVPAWLLARLYRRPLVYHCYDYADQSPLSSGARYIWAFQRRFARTADLVIVPDAERAAIMMRELRLRRPPLIVANAPISRPPATDEALPGALAERGRYFERIVLRQGRIGEGHAIEVTLRSMPSWSSKNWGFVLIGPGDPAYLERLAELAHDLGVERQFVILPPVGYDQVARFTGGADIGHALYESIHINNMYIATASNKVMEYLAAGIPLLVSTQPGLRALVERHACGVIADEADPASIARAVDTLLGDDQRRQRLGEAGAHAFESIYSYERQFAPAIDAFHCLIVGGDGGGHT